MYPGTFLAPSCLLVTNNLHDRTPVIKRSWKWEIKLLVAVAPFAERNHDSSVQQFTHLVKKKKEIHAGSSLNQSASYHDALSGK